MTSIEVYGPPESGNGIQEVVLLDGNGNTTTQNVSQNFNGLSLLKDPVKEKIVLTKKYQNVDSVKLTKKGSGKVSDVRFCYDIVEAINRMEAESGCYTPEYVYSADGTNPNALIDDDISTYWTGTADTWFGTGFIVRVPSNLNFKIDGIEFFGHGDNNNRISTIEYANPAVGVPLPLITSWPNLGGNAIYSYVGGSWFDAQWMGASYPGQVVKQMARLDPVEAKFVRITMLRDDGFPPELSEIYVCGDDGNGPPTIPDAPPDYALGCDMLDSWYEYNGIPIKFYQNAYDGRPGSYYWYDQAFAYGWVQNKVAACFALDLHARTVNQMVYQTQVLQNEMQHQGDIVEVESLNVRNQIDGYWLQTNAIVNHVINQVSLILDWLQQNINNFGGFLVVLADNMLRAMSEILKDMLDAYVAYLEQVINNVATQISNTFARTANQTIRNIKINQPTATATITATATMTGTPTITSTPTITAPPPYDCNYNDWQNNIIRNTIVVDVAGVPTSYKYVADFANGAGGIATTPSGVSLVNLTISSSSGTLLYQADSGGVGTNNLPPGEANTIVSTATNQALSLYDRCKDDSVNLTIASLLAFIINNVKAGMDVWEGASTWTSWIYIGVIAALILKILVSLGIWLELILGLVWRFVVLLANQPLDFYYAFSEAMNKPPSTTTSMLVCTSTTDPISWACGMLGGVQLLNQLAGDTIALPLVVIGMLVVTIRVIWQEFANTFKIDFKD